MQSSVLPTLEFLLAFCNCKRIIIGTVLSPYHLWESLGPWQFHLNSLVSNTTASPWSQGNWVSAGLRLSLKTIEDLRIWRQ